MARRTYRVHDRMTKVQCRRPATVLITIVAVSAFLGFEIPSSKFGTIPSVKVRAAQPPPDDHWPAYGGDAGGNRYSTLTQITHWNVDALQVAWTYRTGEMGQNAASSPKLTFEATPIHFDGRLYLSTSYGKVIALDPTTGAELWTFDAKIDRRANYSEVTSRGVSAWRDPRARANVPCVARIFFGTIDARLMAVDARSGQPCVDFGENGKAHLAL